MTVSSPGLRVSASQPRTPIRLGVVVVHDIVDSIVTRRLPVGSSLPTEAVLCEEFGVSRTIIRESIKRIEEKGLLIVEQGRRGTTIAPTDNWNLADPVVLSCLIEHDDTMGTLDQVVSVRAALESDMASVAARLAKPRDIKELQDLHNEMVRVSDDADAFRDADIAFHASIMRTSSVDLARSMARSLVDHAMESKRYKGIAVGDAVAATVAEHEQILEAIIEADPDRARHAMLEHIHVAWRRRRTPSGVDQ